MDLLESDKWQTYQQDTGSSPSPHVYTSHRRTGRRKRKGRRWRNESKSRIHKKSYNTIYTRTFVPKEILTHFCVCGEFLNFLLLYCHLHVLKENRSTPQQSSYLLFPLKPIIDLIMNLKYEYNGKDQSRLFEHESVLGRNGLGSLGVGLLTLKYTVSKIGLLTLTQRLHTK